ncbi:unnamed protein product [Euphydryas editha]|uniref:Uncharacterized protein n=1 Tax=Euphydryas editha TaxID=104508 RepID=A0AAU9TW26_EUPED|nr:unnamed protein product [Euphydryas editha]
MFLIDEEDEEALENSIIKISKKELNDLVTELFHIFPEGTNDQVHDIQNVLGESNNTKGKIVWEGKIEPLSDGESNGQGNAAQIPSDRRDSTNYSIGNIEQDDNDENKHMNIIDTSVNGEITNKQCSSTSKESEASKNATAKPGRKSTGAHRVTLSADEGAPPPPPAPPPPSLRARLQAVPLTVNIQVDQAVEMYPQQVQILQQQLRQHIQLAASNFMQLFLHPVHWSFAPQYKEYLVSLHNMTLKYPKSVVDVCNLKPAMDLVESWENSLSENTPESIAMIDRRRITQHNTYFGDFPEMFKNVVANSSVFLYPYLLPPVPYKGDYNHKRNSFLRSEDE